MAGGAGVDAPYEGRLVLEDGFGFERDPVAGEGAVSAGELEGDGGWEHLEFHGEGAVGGGGEFG